MNSSLVWKTISGNIREFLKQQKAALSGADPESLHRMRVAGRRLRISLWCFKSLFPKKEYRKIKNAIRNSCASSGLARDLDTQVAILTKLKANKSLIASLLIRRKELQPGVELALSGLDGTAMKAKISACLKAPAAQLDRRALRKISRKKIRKSLKKMLSRKNNRGDKLHSLRISAKRLRYTMEIFRNLYAGPLNVYIERAALIQKKLGDMRNYISISRNRDLNGLKLKDRLLYQADESYADFKKIWMDRSVWTDLDKLIGAVKMKKPALNRTPGKKQPLPAP
jgi:CHAD domain-containing protein